MTFTLLALLTFLAGLALTLSRLLAHPLFERLDAAHQVARILERLGPLIGRVPPDGGLGLGERLPDLLDVRPDLLLERF